MINNGNKAVINLIYKTFLLLFSISLFLVNVFLHFVFHVTMIEAFAREYKGPSCDFT